MDNLNFCEELLGVCEENKFLSKLKNQIKKIKSKGDIENLIIYMNLCEAAWLLSEKVGELPDSIKVRMLMNQKNYWSGLYLDKYL